MKINTKSVTLQAAIVTAVATLLIGIVTSTINIGAVVWQQKQTRELAIVQQRFEAVQGYYQVSYQWPRAKGDLTRLAEAAEAFDRWNQAHALYLSQSEAAMANTIYIAMHSLVESTGTDAEHIKTEAQQISDLILRFHQVLRDAVPLVSETVRCPRRSAVLASVGFMVRWSDDRQAETQQGSRWVMHRI